jgi:aquaporin Z
MGKKLVAEVIGTAILVIFGVGTAVLMGAQVGMLGIALAFGIGVIAAAYGIGAISGAHLNPAVSWGMVAAGRMTPGDAVGYSIAQIVGAIIGAGVVLLIATGQADYDLATNGLGQNGWGEGYLGAYGLTAALVFEVVATFLFVTVILGATDKAGAGALAGLAIGLTLAGIHLVGINVTGVSVNPARSIGPAIFAGGTALAQVWLFVVAPLAGGIAAGILYRAGITRP